MGLALRAKKTAMLDTQGIRKSEHLITEKWKCQVSTRWPGRKKQFLPPEPRTHSRGRNARRRPIVRGTGPLVRHNPVPDVGRDDHCQDSGHLEERWNQSSLRPKPERECERVRLNERPRNRDAGPLPASRALRPHRGRPTPDRAKWARNAKIRRTHD